MNLLARFYLVDAINHLATGDPSKEDGNRFRLDFNFEF